MRLEFSCEGFGGRNRGRGRGGSEIDRKGRMEAIVGVEGRTIDRRLVGIVESKLGEG